MSERLGVRLGRVALRNPVICGAGEHLIEAAGIRSALAAGAAAVVVGTAITNPTAITERFVAAMRGTSGE